MAVGARIAIFTDARDWHARQLTRAFSARGLAAVVCRLEEARFDSGSRSGLWLSGFGAELPGLALVRSVAAGSFEAVTRRLGILHALRELGVAVWNDARAIERCVDKSMTSFLLARAGIPTPPTWAVEGRQEAERVLAAAARGGPLVLKPLFGSQGRGLRLVGAAADLPPPEEVGDVYYLQGFVRGRGDSHCDMRLFVVAGRVAAAMTRRAATWITNVKQGGRPERLSPDPEVCRLALGAAAAVGAEFCGVDLIRDGEGRVQVLEVNSMPAWSGLQSVADCDIAGLIADAAAARLSQCRPLETVR